MSSTLTNRDAGLVPTQLFIGGTWRDARSGNRFAVEDPATGETLGEVADAGPRDALDALGAADDAREDWARTAPRDRAEILRRAFELVTTRAGELARLVTLEMGKPVSESLGEAAYSADFLRWFSEEAVRIDGGYAVSPDGRSRLMVMRQPVGPCLLVTPWNFPLAMITRKLGPALAAGCTVVIKPAEQTPLSALAITAILEEAGVPAGVVNVVPTSDPAGVVAPLLTDARMRKLSFTGSTAVGSELIRQSADRVLRLSMELGGNAPFVVFDDADLEKAVDGAMIAKMRNNGEACTAANRFYVQAGVAERFTSMLSERMRGLRMGHGTDEGVQLGPLIDSDGRQKVVDLVDDAVRKGATCTTGGRAVDGAGYFYEPTVLLGVSSDARLTREEIFGPVAPVFVFEDEEDAVARANETDFGLLSYVYTEDVSRALRVAERLETGMVGLNQGVVSNAAAPFGGVKMSGLGREGGREGIQEYLEIKYVAIAP
jgi:succinate-semialdehyde dehydrogenase/glutarate-semialdehyde dehydrogenase